MAKNCTLRSLVQETHVFCALAGLAYRAKDYSVSSIKWNEVIQCNIREWGVRPLSIAMVAKANPLGLRVTSIM